MAARADAIATVPGRRTGRSVIGKRIKCLVAWLATKVKAHKRDL